MGDELNLNADEQVVDRMSKVGYGGFWSFNNELILTNQNVILVKKGFLGDTQEVVKFPLSSIRVANGQVQAKIGHPEELITGVKVERDEFAWVGDTLAMAESVTNTINNLKSSLGIKSTEQVSIKCPSCGAGLTGTKGETVQCPYCGTYVTL